MTTTSRPGRPRDESVDVAVLTATANRLASDGYERMTIEDVARDAGVSRPTVYRRWPSKAELVIAAVANLISPERHEPTGDIRADLLDIARSLHEKWRSGRYLGLLGTAITERPHHPEVYDAYRERLVNPRRDSVRAVLERGIDEGILAPDVDVEVVIAMFVGSYYATAMADEWDQAEDWPQRIVAVITRTLGLD